MLTNTIEIGTARRLLRRMTRAARTAVSPRAPIPVAFAFAVLAVLATAAPEQAAAQTVTTFISNTGQSIDSNVNNLRATAFTTGTGAYTLSSVAIYQGAQVHATPLVQIYDQSSGLPGNLVATMTNPGTLVNNAVNVFTAPANTTLNASTTYWVVTSNSADSEGIGFRVHRTTSSTLDSGTAAGWSLGGGAWRRRNTNPWATSTYRILFEIRGTGTAQTTTNAAPTLANAIPDQTAIAATGTAFSYQFPSNTFNDTDTGDTLSYTATQADGTDLPTWLTFTGSTRTFTGTPTASDVETVSVRVTATDTSNATVSDGFDITVVNGAGICARTAAVRDALLVKITGVTDCAVVTDTHLAAITGALFLNGKYIPVLAPGDFDGLTALTRLNLFDTSLTGLPAGIFDELTAVTELAVNGNNLTGLPAGVFDNLTALTILGLSDNSLTGFPAGVFDNLTALTNLNLSGNSLTGLPAGVFDKLTALTYLSLSRNSLTALSAGVFDKLTALTELRLSFNDLTALPAGVFDELTALTALHLNNNRSLTGLPAGVFDGLTALTTLNLSNDSLTALPDDVFEPLTSLTTLDLPGNPGALFSPTAVALPDDGTVPAGGGTVMLDGSGSGGAWGTNVTYSWALTTPMSGVTVTFDDAAIAEPTVTIPQVTAGTDLVFTLTVTGRGGSNGISTATDTATVTPTATANAAPTVANTIPDQTATEGTAFSYQVPANTFNDTDTSDTLTYSATKPDDSTLPTWLSFDATTRTFTGTPAATDVETVAVKVTATDTSSATVSNEFNIVVSADTTPPTLTIATVNATGTGILLEFTEPVSGLVGVRPPASAFTVTADGIAVPVVTGQLAGSLGLQVTPVLIRQGQVVVITYTDPTTGDDALAAQDAAGNDVATFTTGMNSVPAVVNISTLAAVVPNAPTGLTATASGSSTINLSWTAPASDGGSAITGYKIEVSPNGTSSWTAQVADTASTNTTYAHSGLAASTTRHYRVSAINSIGTSTTASNVASATTDAATATAPGAPTGLTATASGPSTINLSWTAPASTGGSAITGYKIEVSSDSGSNWTDQVANTNNAATGYAHTGLAASTTRHYRVYAINGIGTSTHSNVANATTGAATTPGAPTGLTATAGGTSTINLSWTAPASTGGSAITGYKIEVSPNGTSSWTAQVANTGNANTAYADSGLAASTTRHYRVYAINGIGTSTHSNVANATTGAATTDDCAADTTTTCSVSPAATPGGVATGNLEHNGDVDRFSFSVTSGVEYQIDVEGAATSKGSLADPNFALLDSITLIADNDDGGTGLNARLVWTADRTGTVYAQITSAGGSGGTYTLTVTVRTAAATAPGAPTGLTATASGPSTITLSWTAPTSTGGSAITGYQIEASSNGGTTFNVLVATTNNATTTYAHTGLAASTTRHYRVSAINSTGTGTPSNVASATTGAATNAPGAPTGLTATASGPSTINLSWTAPTSTGGSAISGYKIEISPDGITDWTDLVANNATTTYAHTTNLVACLTRYYRVSAINATATGPVSTVAFRHHGGGRRELPAAGLRHGLRLLPNQGDGKHKEAASVRAVPADEAGRDTGRESAGAGDDPAAGEARGRRDAGRLPGAAGERDVRGGRERGRLRPARVPGPDARDGRGPADRLRRAAGRHRQGRLGAVRNGRVRGRPGADPDDGGRRHAGPDLRQGPEQRLVGAGVRLHRECGGGGCQR